MVFVNTFLSYGSVTCVFVQVHRYGCRYMYMYTGSCWDGNTKLFISGYNGAVSSWLVTQDTV